MKFSRLKLLEIMLAIAVVATLLFVALQLMQGSQTDENSGVTRSAEPSVSLRDMDKSTIYRLTMT